MLQERALSNQHPTTSSQICVDDGFRVCAHKTVDNMTCVGVMAGITSLSSNKVHDFMFTFSRHAGVGNDNLHLEKNYVLLEGFMTDAAYLLPPRIRIHFLDNPVPQRGRKKIHERCPRCDGVRIPRYFVFLVFADFLTHSCYGIVSEPQRNRKVDADIPITLPTLCGRLPCPWLLEPIENVLNVVDSF